MSSSGDTLRPLADWPAAARNRIVGVLTDIDDTLTTEGAITPDALQALADLRAAGLHAVCITGRPVGWSEPFAASWPVDAIVAENGAVALTVGDADVDVTSAADDDEEIGLQRTPAVRKLLSKTYQQDAATRTANFARMQAVARRILAEIPGTALATDSPGRETDIAVDHSEFVHLPPDTIAQVVTLMRSEGMHATVSSIHINGWFGEHDKLSGARWIVRSLWGRDLDAEIDRWVYVGDSTNDQTMFAHFPHSVGVANIDRFVPALAHLPRYRATGARGAGFNEVVRLLLDRRPE